jgi:membrane protease YdiL (CAAX protease family)
VIGAFIALTAWNGLVFHGLPGAGPAPGWSELVRALGSVGDGLFGNGNYVANPVTYLVLPLALLLLLGARPRELGFGTGHRVGRVILLWAAIPVAFLAFAVATGQLTVGRIANRLVSNVMQNGFWEEFLFRGALQTRLRRLLTPAWAIVIQALVFGAWHLGLGYASTGYAGFLPALASTLVHQATIGLAFGIIFERTRNLLAPSVAHVLANSIG